MGQRGTPDVSGTLDMAAHRIRTVAGLQAEGQSYEAARIATQEVNHAMAAALCVDYLERHGNQQVEDFLMGATRGSVEDGQDVRRAAWMKGSVLPIVRELRDSRPDEAAQKATD